MAPPRRPSVSKIHTSEIKACCTDFSCHISEIRPGAQKHLCRVAVTRLKTDGDGTEGTALTVRTSASHQQNLRNGFHCFHDLLTSSEKSSRKDRAPDNPLRLLLMMTTSFIVPHKRDKKKDPNPIFETRRETQLGCVSDAVWHWAAWSSFYIPRAGGSVP